MMSGGASAHSKANSLPSAAEAALDLVVDQQRAGVVAEPADGLQLGFGPGARAALALHGLEDDRRGGGADQFLQAVEVAELRADEAGRRRAEALHVAGVGGGVDRRERAAVEGAVEADDVDALGVALHPVVLARGLDGALDGFRARVGEEDYVGEGRIRQHRRQRLLAGDAEDVGGVPELLGLVLHRLHELRMAVAQGGDRDPRHAVEVFLAILGVEAHALASLERQLGALVDAHDVIAGNGGSSVVRHRNGPPKRKRPRPLGRRGLEGLAFSSSRGGESTFPTAQVLIL
jgi:hypothetical protein